MKQLKKIIAAFLLCFTTVNASAQSTYTWNVANWSSDGNGSFTTNNNTLTSTGYNWGCCGIKTTTSFKIPKRQTFLVIKGTHIADGGTNPCLYNVNGTNLGYKPKLTVNAEGTLAYVDITGQLPAETDFFGNVSINQIGIFLQQPGGGEDANIIEDIDFVSADLLDMAEASNLTFQGGWPVVTGESIATDITLARSNRDFKKTLTFKQVSGNGDMGLVVNVSPQLNHSNLFFVIESDNASLNSFNRMKLRTVTVGGTGYGNNNGGAGVNAKEISSGRYLYIHNFFTNSETSDNLLQLWEENTVLTPSSYLLYINNSQNTTVNIYRMGFYSLGEIFKLYPSLASEKWWLQRGDNNHLALEIHGAASENQIRVNNASAEGKEASVNYVLELMRSMGTLPNNFTKIDLRNIKMSDTEQPLKEDALSNFDQTFMFSWDALKYFPTLVPQKVALNPGTYWAYKDGIAPIKNDIKVSDGNQYDTYWYDFTRKFVQGYNSCVLPFKTVISDLPTGLTAYVVNDYSGNSIRFSEATSDIAANTPFIIKADETGIYSIRLLGVYYEGESKKYIDTYDYTSYYYPSNLSEGAFVGSFVQEVPSGTYASTANFGLKADGTAFARMGDQTKTSYYRAFLALPASSSARAIDVVFGDESTGINNVSDNENVNGVYDLQGRSVNGQLQKGLYIINGKKVFVR